MNSPIPRTPPGLLIACSILAFGLLIGGCQGVGPVEPTLIMLPTDTASPSPTSGPEVTIPVPTLPPTWTPAPTNPIPPTVTLLPNYTPFLVAVTSSVTAQIPIAVTSNGRGATTLVLTEAQLNAALARHFDTAPIPNYIGAPRLMLGDNAMSMIMRIVPPQTANRSGPQSMTLTLTLAIYDGALEVHPTQLAPLDSGVTTAQVKRGQALLQQTLTDIVSQAVGSARSVTYNYVNVRPDGVTLTVVAQ